MKISPLLLLALLAGCGPLVQIGGNAPPPQALLTLTATAPPRAYAGPAKVADTIGIDAPSVPAALQTLRLPVTTGPTSVQYLVGASWSEQPARQFQRLLADTIAAAGTPVVDLHQAVVAPPRLLTGSLRACGLDVSDPARPVVRVRYDAQLAGKRAASVALQRFETTESVADQSPAAVAAALNRAANRIAADVAAWVSG